jgi:hypothetical protein
MKKIYKRVGLVVLVMAIALIVSPSQAERDQELKEEIEKIRSEVLSIPELNVEENLYSYTRLSEYYTKNESYLLKRAKYQHLSSNESMCREKARESDQKSLISRDTYEGIESARSNKWISEREFMTTSSFTGLNAYGVDQKFSAQYQCTFLSEGMRIKRIFLKRLRS